MVELIKRRSFLFGLGALLAAPAVVKASSLMPISSAKLILPDTQIIGAIKANIGPIPNGWVLCDGRWLVKQAYSDLYAVIGDKYDARLPGQIGGDFYIPDLRDQSVRDGRGRYVIYAGHQQTIHMAGLNDMTESMNRREGDAIAAVEFPTDGWSWPGFTDGAKWKD